MSTLVLDGLAAFFDFFGTYGIVRAIIVMAVLGGLWLGLRRAGLDDRARTATWLAVALPLMLWMAAVWQLAAAGAFQARPGAVPLIPFAIVVPVAAGLVLLTRSTRVAAALDAIPPAWLVGLQVYRVFGAAFLVQWGLGRLSGTFALPAGCGDVLVGLLALPAAYALQAGVPRARSIAVAWNVLGILDLVLAIALGLLGQTGRLPGAAQPPAPLSYPLVMIPAFAVPLSLILHGVSLWQLRRLGRQTARDTEPAVTRRGASPSAQST